MRRLLSSVAGTALSKVSRTVVGIVLILSFAMTIGLAVGVPVEVSLLGALAGIGVLCADSQDEERKP